MAPPRDAGGGGRTLRGSERRRAHAASHERYSRDDGGYSQGAHLGVYSRTVLRCVRRTRSPLSGRSDGEAEAASGG